MRLIALLLAILVLVPSDRAAATDRVIPDEWQGYVFKNGLYPTADYAGCTDTWIDESNPTFNYGASSFLNLQGASGGTSTKKILIKFDISAIPSDEEIVEVRLRLYQSDADLIVNHPVVENLRLLFPFVEGTKTGETEAGSANWTSAGSANWAVAGAAGILADASNTGITPYHSSPASAADTSVINPTYIGPDTLTGWPRNAHVDDAVTLAMGEWRPKGGATDIARRTRGWIELQPTAFFQKVHRGQTFNHGLLFNPDPDGYGVVGLATYFSSNKDDKLYRPELLVWTVRKSGSTSASSGSVLGFPSVALGVQ